MKEELKVKIKSFGVNADVEGLESHINDRICNPIELSKFVTYWLHSTSNYGGTYIPDFNNKYNNICSRWNKKYVKDDDVTVRYYFSEDNWDMVIEIFKNLK